MRSERKWRLNYVDANSECSEDNQLAQLRGDLNKYMEMANSAQSCMQSHRLLNEQLKVTLDEMTAFNNQIIMKIRELSKDRTDEQLKRLLEELEMRVHFQETKYSQLERLYTEQSKELGLCTEVLQNQQRESELLRRQLGELQGMRISIGQYEELKSKVNELELLNGQLNVELKAECLRIQQSSDASLQEERRKYLENYEQFLEEKKQLRRQIESLGNTNKDLCEQLKDVQNSQLDSISNRLTVHSTAEEPRWKEHARQLEVFTLSKELAMSKIKIQRLELALENSDRKIAELQSELYPSKKPFTASEVKLMFCPKPTSRVNNMRSPAPRLRRLPEGVGSPSLSSGSPFPLQQQKTEPKPLQSISRNDSQVGFFSVTLTQNGEFTKRQNVNPNIANIKLLDSVQLKHSDTETNLNSALRYQPLRLNNNSSTAGTSFTDRQFSRKTPLLQARPDTKWINLMR